jgi:hypothetical protein
VYTPATKYAATKLPWRMPDAVGRKRVELCITNQTVHAAQIPPATAVAERTKARLSRERSVVDVGAAMLVINESPTPTATGGRETDKANCSAASRPVRLLQPCCGGLGTRTTSSARIVDPKVRLRAT